MTLPTAHSKTLNDFLPGGEHRKGHVNSKAKALLRRTAPALAALDPAARWDRDVVASIREAIDQETPGQTMRIDLWNAVCHLISMGNDHGIWNHPQPTRQALETSAPSRIDPDDAKYRQAVVHRTILFQRHESLVRCEDPDVLAGAVIASAVFFSAIWDEDRLMQLLTAPLERSGPLVYATLQLGAPGRRWNNVRRCFLDPFTVDLLLRYQRQPDKPTVVSLNEALARAYCFLQRDRPTAKGLMNISRAWWTPRLPSLFLDYLIQAQLGVSLPVHAWTRLTTGLPLAPGQAPMNEPNRDNPDLSFRPDDGPKSAHWSMDRQALRGAVRELIGVLAQRANQPRPTPRSVNEALVGWRQRHDHLGGWTDQLHDWVAFEIQEMGSGSEDRKSRFGLPGLQRYLEGFAHRFVQHFATLPPHLVGEEPLVALEKMEALLDSLLPLTTAGTAATGLRRFARFLKIRGGPVLPFESEWRLATPPGNVDANLITPGEYTRVLAHLDLAMEQGTYPHLRARAMTILAFRTGPRVEELVNIRFRDVMATTDRRHAHVDHAPTDFQALKTRSSRRRNPLQHFLTQAELTEFLAFVDVARRLNGGAGSDDAFIFAQPSAPKVPPHVDEVAAPMVAAMRSVTGDPTLVFHHLRHSAATWAFVRLFLDPDDIQQLDWIPHWHTDRVDVSGEHFSSSITSRGALDPARVYIPSRLLGHSSPATTLKCYVHLLDLIVAARLARDVGFPADVQARLAGIQTTSIHRAKSRKKRRATV